MKIKEELKLNVHLMSKLNVQKLGHGYGSVTHNGPSLEATNIFYSRGTHNKAVVHPDSGISFRDKKK